jgi:hypothetical protein
MAITEVPTISALEGIVSPAGGDCAYLTAAGREGAFTFDSSDLSAEVALDSAQGVYVAPTGTTPPGASGAWVRDTNGKAITPFMFGAMGDGSTDDLAALQAFNDWFFSSVRTDCVADCSGQFAIRGKLFIGPAAAADPTAARAARYRVGGDLQVIQTNSDVDNNPVGTFETCEIRYLRSTVWDGQITVTGRGPSGLYANRTDGIGIHLNDCLEAVFTGGLRAYNFWFIGIYCPSSTSNFNDGASLGRVHCANCGSGVDDPTFSLLSTWNSPVAVGSQPIQVRINGKLYYVNSFDRGAGTIDIYPWLDSAAAAAGTGNLTWVYGGGLMTRGGDSGIIQVRHLAAFACGRGLVVSSLYGPRIMSTNIEACGTAVSIATAPNYSSVETSIDSLYVESNAEDIVCIGRPGAVWFNINSTYGLTLSKVWSVGNPNYNDNPALEGGILGTGYDQPNATLAFRGALLQSFKRSAYGRAAAGGLLGTFKDHKIPPKIRTEHANALTITLYVVSTLDEYNRLFGYTGATWRFVGTGVNDAPTGTFTFNPPTKDYANCGTINGAFTVTVPDTRGMVANMPVTGTNIPASTIIQSVDSRTQITLSQAAAGSGTVTLTVTGSINGAFAAVSFSDFNGPADFEINHTDAFELIWRVALVAGRMGHGWTGVDQLTNANKTLNLTSSKLTQYLNVALTVVRTVTLPSPGHQGRRFRVVRSANATGAFSLNVQTSSGVLLKSLTGGAWCDVEDDGTEYQIMASGSL